MMKALLAALVLTSAVSAFASHDEDQAEESRGLEYCSAQLIYADGSFREQVRVDCEGEYAGKCVKQTGQVWTVTSDVECDQAAARQK